MECYQWKISKNSCCFPLVDCLYNDARFLFIPFLLDSKQHFVLNRNHKGLKSYLHSTYLLHDIMWRLEINFPFTIAPTAQHSGRISHYPRQKLPNCTLCTVNKLLIPRASRLFSNKKKHNNNKIALIERSFHGQWTPHHAQQLQSNKQTIITTLIWSNDG